MPFVNSLEGASEADLEGLAVHLHDWFPERQEPLRAALRFPNPALRGKFLRTVVQKHIGYILEDADTKSAPPAQKLADGAPTDAGKKAETGLAMISPKVIEQSAAKAGMTVEEYKTHLLARLRRSAQA